MKVTDHLSRERLILGSILLLGLAVRSWGLGSESLWFDEAVSANFAITLGYGEILLEVPTRDPHPPLYYALLKLWTTLAGTSEAGLRSLSVLADLVSTVLVYGVATRLYDRRTGLLGALLFALSPFYVWYAQEARMYALLTAFALLSYYSLLAVVGKDESWWRNGWTYVGATTAMCYTHALAPLVVLAQNLYLADGLLDRGYVGGLLPQRWVRMQAIVAAAIFPYYFELFTRTFLIDQFMGYISWIPEPSLLTLWEVAGTYVGRTIPPASPGSASTLWGAFPVLGDVFTLIALLVVLGVVVVSIRRDRDTDPEHLSPTLLLVTWFAVPILGMFALSKVVTPLLVARYTAAAGVAVLVLLARGLVLPFESSRLPLDPDRGTVAVAGLVVLVLAVPVAGIHADTQKQQWREAASTVEANASPGDAVLVTPFWSVEAYDYYQSREGLEPTGVRGDAGFQEVRRTTEGSRVVWLVRLDGNPAPGLRSVLDRLGFSLTNRTEFHDVTVFRYAR